MPDWTLRDISRDAAAAALRMPAATLDVWLHRYKCPSEKRKGTRLFSLLDLIILQTARQLLSPRLLAADAMRLTSETVDGIPPPDAVLFVDDDGKATIGTVDDWPDHNFRAVPIGQLALTIQKRLEARDVAL